MGSDMSLAIGPEVEVDLAALTDSKDYEVSVPEDRTAFYGTKAPNVECRWLEGFVVPDTYDVPNGEAFYRIQGVCFGRVVGRLGDHILLECTWPSNKWLVDTHKTNAELISKHRCVGNVKVPKGWTDTGFAAFRSLPCVSKVTMISGDTLRLRDLPGGLQRNINLCYK